MAAIKRDGKTKDMWFPKVASTAISANSFVKFDGSGHVTPCVSTDATILGVYEGPAIASSDATNSLIKITVPIERAVEWTVDVEAGTLTAASVGVTFDLQDATGVNQGGTSHNPVTCTAFLSASKGVFTFAPVL
jgi:hypothetical protein